VAHNGESKDDSDRCQKANVQMKRKDYKSVSDEETDSDDQPSGKKLRIGELLIFRFILINGFQIRFTYKIVFGLVTNAEVSFLHYQTHLSLPLTLVFNL